MEKSKTNRQAWIDNARAFAMIAVVWMHTVNIGLKDGILPSGMVMSFNMPLFVFISGYCAYHSLERIHQMADLWHYIKKLVMCIGIPNICYWAVDYWIANVFQQNITKSIATSIFLVLIISYGYLLYNRHLNTMCENLGLIAVLLLNICGIFNTFWFLPFILKTSVIAGICTLACKKLNSNIAVFVIWFSFLMIVCPGRFHATMEMFTYYLLGLFANKKKLLYIKHRSLGVIAFSGLILYVILFYLKLGDINFYFHDAISMLMQGEGYSYLYRQIVAIFAIISVISFFKICNCFQITPLLSKIGTYTLAIYPIHAIFINIAKNSGGVNLQGIIVYPLCVILLTGLSLLMVSIFKQNEFLSFIFLGKINKKTYE